MRFSETIQINSLNKKASLETQSSKVPQKLSIEGLANSSSYYTGDKSTLIASSAKPIK